MNMGREGPPDKASTESIAFVGRSKTYRALSETFESTINDEPEVRFAKLAETIKKTTGAQHVKIRFGGPKYELSNVSVYFYPVDLNGLFSQVTRGEYAPSRFRYADHAKGHGRASFEKAMGIIRVDGRMEGFMAKIPFQLVLSDNFFSKELGLTSDEMAALFLHEIGHVETTFELMGVVVAGSILMAAAIEDFMKSTDRQTRKRVVTDTIKHLSHDADRINVDTLANESDERNFEAVMLREVIEEAKTEMGSIRTYNGEAEFLADSFAIQHGAGGALASAYYKIAKSAYKLSGMVSPMDSYGEYLVAESMKLSTLAVKMIQPSALKAATEQAAMVMAEYMHKGMPRNTVKERLEAMHHSIVQLAKDQTLPRDIALEVLNDATYVSALMETVAERLPFLAIIARSASDNLRADRAQIDIQRDLSRLAHNPLYLRSLELKNVQ